ncbi:Zinc finger PHD-type [Penicillium odoratum]|uniref:Zinc finger PHD-type n=1 Tax=Penicillium odoratum TaxID=1167516 RepID=UPI002546D887|nr:Zinc finger PHD-type [Penicillium odoratum]KAJ5760890.1 Zinc finger PHD-type [Penicillium odoratum]
MPMTDETDHSGGVILDGPFDPDAQATVTDFIDYTEYLPADLMRSLTLIRGLDNRYLDSAQEVHNLSKTYGQLPDLPLDERPSAISLRREISHQLDRAVNARESAYAEACRLYDVVDRHFDRLSCIRQKLETLPRPPSVEPSPPPEPTPKRARKDKKSGGSTTRITLRLDNRKKSGTQKSRSRRVGIEQFADFNPDSPIASTEQSDADAELPPVHKPRPPKKEKQRRPSSGVAASTAIAIASLKPPPPDAQIGSEDLPWMRLTDWEMTRLRKKMKKNAMWQPSDVMIQRELALSGRGWEAYRVAKLLAEETGAPFLDCDNIEENHRGEKLKDMEETKLSNRGMKLNEAKKLKRELLAREAAANGGDIAISTKPAPAQGNSANRSSRKRKREEIAVEDDVLDSALESVSVPTPVPAPSSKSRRRSDRGAPSSGSADATNAPVPEIAPLEPAEVKVSPPLPSPTGSKRSVKSAVQPVTTPTPPVTRPSSRRSAAAALSEPRGASGAFPIAIAGGRDLRIKSATPARKTPVRETSHAPSVPAPARRRKRPAPGPVSTGQDGGAAVSYGHRKAKPSKKRILVPNSQDVRVDEDGVLEEINANEPRYCLCGDVSFGTMICCENQDCDREWFHLDCIGLSEVPSRTAKWYCPECRVKFSKGSDGIVRGGSRR